LLATAIYAAAMGWLEAVVVIYIHGMAGLPVDATRPMPSPEARMAAVMRLPWVLPVEQTREAATILMLAAVGWLAGSRAGSRFGAFLLTFGVWDIAYYAALRVLIGWPPSLLARDLLFLIPPGPWWHQPVLLPVAISCAMIAVGAWLHRRHESPRPTMG
jgi:hypothetical protein